MARPTLTRLQDLYDMPSGAPPSVGRVPTWDGTQFVYGAPSDLGANGVDEFFEQRRTSEVSTCPNMLATSSLAPSQGVVYSAPAVCRTAGTYTRIRFFVNVAFVGTTDCKVGVYDAPVSGTASVLATSASIAAASLTASTELVVLLDAGVTLTQGEVVCLAFASVGSSAGQIKGNSTLLYRASTASNPDGSPRITSGPLAGLPLSRTLTGWTPGPLPPIPVASAGSSALIPQLELLP